MGTLIQDLRYGIRMLAKSPGFTAIAVLTLALGIGANTAIFSVVHAVLLRPLPFPESTRLLAVQTEDPKEGALHPGASYPDFFDWRKENRVFSRIAAYHDSLNTLTGIAEPQHLSGEIVSADFFATLGVGPEFGRGFLPEDEQPGHQVTVLSDHLWRTAFGADRGIIGRGILLNGESYTVVGVMPPDFDFPITTPPELWVTLSADSNWFPQRGARILNVVARLKPGVSLRQAQAEMGQITAKLAKEYPETNTRFAGAHLETELDSLVGDTRQALIVLFGAVGLVLLIACANVANLVLVRSIDRHKEIAIRQAIGAGRTRIVCQLLTESMLLALLGGAFGLILAEWGTAALAYLIPRSIPRISQIGINGAVFAFALLASVMTGIMFGLLPAVQAARTDLVEALKKEGGTGGSGGVRHGRWRGALVVSETALALALLMGAGLMIRSFAQLENVNPGFNPRELLTFHMDLPDARYSTVQQVNFYHRLQENLQTLPGVRSVAQIFPLPLNGNQVGVGFLIEGRPVSPGNEPAADFRTVSPGYFQSMGIPLLKGREFWQTDSRDALPVVVVNEKFAQDFFPNENPIGKRITPGISDHAVKELPAREIVGVVGNVKWRSLGGPATPEYYVPHSQCQFPGLDIAVRTQGDPSALVDAVRATVKQMDSDLPVYDVKKMDEYTSAAVAQPRFSTFLLGLFAALALMLTGLGLYGVVSYAVAQRTHEIGIRRALGAETADVLWVVMRHVMALVLLGWLAGAIASVALTRFISSELCGVGANDPLTFAGVSVILVGVAILASYIPARRAMRVDPMVALRYE